jgi:hypothetical protein
MQPFLALITPLGGGGSPSEPPAPSHPIAGGPWPSHPIVNPPPGQPGQPPGYWGGVAPPWVDNTLPGWQPRPSHPIAPGGRPPGIWGGPPLYPDQGLPGPQPTPTPPIFLPPGTIPDTKPEHPIYIPPTIPGVPTHPIVLPPPGSGEKPDVLENWDAKTGWTAETGWVVVIVPNEGATVPTPSA